VDVHGEVALPFLALLVCGMLASVALAGQASAPRTGLGIVQGQVLLEPSDQPIRKVTVRLSLDGGEGGEKFSATTDAAGRFRIGEVKPGTYRVTIFREGYFRDYQRERQSTIVVQAGESNRESVFFLQRCAVITGTIVDAEGDPLRGVPVMAVMALPRSRSGTGVVIAAAPTNDLGNSGSRIYGQRDTSSSPRLPTGRMWRARKGQTGRRRRMLT
jgi:Carboxypeptidase regulatory-like domain